VLGIVVDNTMVILAKNKYILMTASDQSFKENADHKHEF